MRATHQIFAYAWIYCFALEMAYAMPAIECIFLFFCAMWMCVWMPIADVLTFSSSHLNRGHPSSRYCAEILMHFNSPASNIQIRAHTHTHTHTRSSNIWIFSHRICEQSNDCCAKRYLLEAVQCVVDTRYTRRPQKMLNNNQEKV